MRFRQFAALLLALTLGFAPHPALAVLKGVAAAPGLQNAASVAITGGTIAGTTESSNTFSQTLLNTNVRTVIQQGGVPLIAPGSFTMSNNGAITLGTANNKTYLNAFIYMLAGDVAAGVPAAAGWYYCTFSSTTVGTVFNNTYTTGVPTVPGSPTAFATTGPGARTGDTGVETAFQVTIPALAANSQVIVSLGSPVTNSAGTKTFIINLGGTAFHNVTANSVARGTGSFMIGNAGATNRQLSQYLSLMSFTVAAQEANGTVDTSTSTTLTVTVQRGTATDNIVLLPIFVEASL